MWNDAVDLRDFYATPLGRVARRLIGRRLRLMWPDVRGFNLLGLGYATPFLGAFRDEAARVVALAPAPQGVLHWPTEGGGLSALVDENGLPLPDRAFDRVLVVHALECAEHTRPMMREVWRVMSDGGRLIVVAPNRRGLWAQFEGTPFGYGRPYSTGQLSRGLRQAMFTPSQARSALFLPPFRSRMLLSSAGPIEEMGERWFKRFAGVVVFEATKQIYAGRIVFGGEAAAPGYLAVPSR
jgi:SAM-dependent methyltransferase